SNSLTTSWSGVVMRDRGNAQYDDVWGVLLSQDTILAGVVEINNTEFLIPKKIDSSWHHIGMIYDGEKRSLLLYVDKQLINEVTTEYGQLSSNDSLYFTIGAYSTKDFMFDGLIDDVRIYNRALSEPEIQVLYHDGQSCENCYQAGRQACIDDPASCGIKSKVVVVPLL
ncbi:LamG domain-containing protein, partial [Desulfobulbus sp. TB]|nr:LamG domain-containing protein [Desulfobulbus sp. TB]